MLVDDAGCRSRINTAKIYGVNCVCPAMVNSLFVAVINVCMAVSSRSWEVEETVTENM